jgi:hypothetical protein
MCITGLYGLGSAEPYSLPSGNCDWPPRRFAGRPAERALPRQSGHDRRQRYVRPTNRQASIQWPSNMIPPPARSSKTWDSYRHTLVRSMGNRLFREGHQLASKVNAALSGVVGFAAAVANFPLLILAKLAPLSKATVGVSSARLGLCEICTTIFSNLCFEQHETMNVVDSIVRSPPHGWTTPAAHSLLKQRFSAAKARCDGPDHCV